MWVHLFGRIHTAELFAKIQLFRATSLENAHTHAHTKGEREKLQNVRDKLNSWIPAWASKNVSKRTKCELQKGRSKTWLQLQILSFSIEPERSSPLFFRCIFFLTTSVVYALNKPAQHMSEVNQFDGSIVSTEDSLDLPLFPYAAVCVCKRVCVCDSVWMMNGILDSLNSTLHWPMLFSLNLLVHFFVRFCLCRSVCFLSIAIVCVFLKWMHLFVCSFAFSYHSLAHGHTYSL